MNRDITNLILCVSAGAILLIGALYTRDVKADTLYCKSRSDCLDGEVCPVEGAMKEAIGNGLYQFKTENNTIITFSYADCSVELK